MQSKESLKDHGTPSSGPINTWQSQKEKRKRKGSWGIVITIEKCDENGQQAKWLKWSFRIVMKNYIEHCDDTVMEHCDDKNSGALWWHGHGTLWR